MKLRTTAIVLALVVLFGAAHPGYSAQVPGVATVVAKNESAVAANAKADSASARPAVPGASDSTAKPLSSAHDSASVRSRAPADSGSVPDSSAHKRALPERTLTLRQQVMFAGGFMAFVALMMASMQNFNP